MEQLTFKEIELINWVLNNISVLSVEEKHRKNVDVLKRKPFTNTLSINYEEKQALCACLDYFCNIYSASIIGYPNGNRTIKSIKERIELLKTVKNKFTEQKVTKKYNLESNL